MDGMIERVADALDVETCGKLGRFALNGLARAAIEAMREPTEQMKDAAYRDAFGRYDYNLETYEVMIAAALAIEPVA